VSKGKDAKAPAPADERLVGRKYLKVLRKHCERLRKSSAHPNRLLHYDDLLTPLLLGFFNPTLRSLRALEDASAAPQLRGCLDVDRACRSTVSDANACLDPDLLNPLTPQQRAAGVLSDRLVRLSPSQPGALAAPTEVLREVVIFDEQRNPDRPVRLLTSLASSDVVGAEVVGEVYRWRWQIELFFRWLKVHANFRHVISHSRNGLTLSFYVAVIGVLLMYLHSGRRVSKYAYNLLCMVAQGSATLADILPILERREHEIELARKRLARIKAEKTPA
jgi:hypothetical protein